MPFRDSSGLRIYAALPRLTHRILTSSIICSSKDGGHVDVNVYAYVYVHVVSLDEDGNLVTDDDGVGNHFGDQAYIHDGHGRLHGRYGGHYDHGQRM